MNVPYTPDTRPPHLPPVNLPPVRVVEPQLPPLTQLDGLLDELVYKPDWSFELLDHWAGERVLQVAVKTFDSDTGRPITVKHRIGVPPEQGWPEGWWERWLFDTILSVEAHEAGEFFWIGSHRPFFPDHGSQ